MCGDLVTIYMYRLICHRSTADATVMTALKLIGDLFHSYHDLFLWLIVLGGDKFKKRVKKSTF